LPNVEWLDVNRRAQDTFRRSKHELAVRLRAATLGRDDPERFFAVVRDSHQRELDGADPVDALEQALEAADAFTSPQRS
jgi:Mg2+/Co2+ transporter CorC